MKLTKEYLNSILEYRDGELYWKKVNKKSHKKIGDRAGSKQHYGYRQICIDNKVHREHRIIWVMFHGDIPDGYIIDHANRIKDDNRIENLQIVTHSQNNLNRNSYRINNRKNGKFQAVFQFDGVRTSKIFSSEQKCITWIEEKKSGIFQESGLTWPITMVE